MNKRIIISLITGALLGVVCILGATLRYQENVSSIYLFSFWFNRLLMGLVIGLISTKMSFPKQLIRSVLLGLFVSFAFYSSTEFFDLIGFLVGGVYGLIIELVNYKFAKDKKI